MKILSTKSYNKLLNRINEQRNTIELYYCEIQKLKGDVYKYKPSRDSKGRFKAK